METQTKTSSTPGPWHIELGSLVVKDSRGYQIALTLRGTPSDEDKANARLIAAAPELLDRLHRTTGLINVLTTGLINVLKQFATTEANIADLELVIVENRAAIAKAEGRA
jgi:hypothetical protein